MKCYNFLCEQHCTNAWDKSNCCKENWSIPTIKNNTGTKQDWLRYCKTRKMYNIIARWIGWFFDNNEWNIFAKQRKKYHKRD